MKPCILTVIGILIALHLQAQKFSTVTNIVFEGAGIRGIAYCGAIKALEEKNLLPGIKRVGGTSAGAITALTISLGYRSDEIVQLISNTPFKKLNDGRYFFPGGMNRLQKYYGWYRGRRFEQWLSKIIETKTGDADITFRRLYDKGFKDLYVTATSLTGQQSVILSREGYPDMKVKDAVRMSMSIPLYFEAVFMDSLGNTYTHPKKKTGLDVMVDGGFVANYPIRLFDSTKYLEDAMPNRFAINTETVGFRMDSDAQIKSDRLNKGLAAMNITSFKEYMIAFYTIVIENLNRQNLTEKDWQRTVSISDGGIYPRIRKLPAEEINRLIDNGYDATITDSRFH